MTIGEVLIQRIIPSFSGTAGVTGIVQACHIANIGENHQLTTRRVAAVAAITTISYDALEALLKRHSFFANGKEAKKRYAITIIGSIVLATAAGRLGAKTESLAGLVASAATALGIKLTCQYLIATITADDDVGGRSS